MKTPLVALAVLAAISLVTQAAELHVATIGNDLNPGTRAAPFRTIQHAADLAQPGDVITVHEGVYRERINPPRGGLSDERRIIYEAARNEDVIIKGSEVVSNWVQVQTNVWKATLPNTFFGNFNPYSDVIHGDWFNPLGRVHHTGAVYLNGDWLIEAATLAEVMKPTGATGLWFGQVDKLNTTLWAQFKGVNPNEQPVEINVRQTVFYPAKTNVNYITVRRFTLAQAATPWAPPTAEQMGLIGTHWSKGWIIEHNVIRYSTCCGVALGKYGDEWDNRSESAEGYVATIRRALTNGWNRDTVGHHIVRNNDISHCEQTGVVGSLGAVFSTIAGNTIHDIHVRRLFTGAEMAGIKLHGAIDVTIRNNNIYDTVLGLWLDWMAQGTRVSANFFHDNGQDLFFEVDHGPLLVDNNLFLSANSLHSRSQGVAYAHNLFAGTLFINRFDGRQTPFLKPHSTELAGLHDNPRGDDRYYNNIFARADLSQYDDAPLPVFMGGNVFLHGSKPCKVETNALVLPEFDPALKLTNKFDGYYLNARFDQKWIDQRTRKEVDTKMLGTASIPRERFESAGGSQIRLDTDYFKLPRDFSNPAPGPFESYGQSETEVKVW